MIGCDGEDPGQIAVAVGRSENGEDQAQVSPVEVESSHCHLLPHSYLSTRYSPRPIGRAVRIGRSSDPTGANERARSPASPSRFLGIGPRSAPEGTLRRVHPIAWPASLAGGSWDMRRSAPIGLGRSPCAGWPVMRRPGVVVVVVGRVVALQMPSGTGRRIHPRRCVMTGVDPIPHPWGVAGPSRHPRHRRGHLNSLRGVNRQHDRQLRPVGETTYRTTYKGRARRKGGAGGEARPSALPP